MYDFSNSTSIFRIEDVLIYIKTANENTINLNNNYIRKAKISVLPRNITNVYLDNNYIDSYVEWDNRNWGIISIKNNNFSCDEFNGFCCKKFLLDNNCIKEITFSNCKINSLSISNNCIININFFDCEIEELNLSNNKITNIITLPNKLKKLDLSFNNLNNVSLKLSDDIEYLDLSNNSFETFEINKLSNSLKYLDLTNNLIKNNTELFKNIINKIEKIYYDTDEFNSDEELDSQINNDINNENFKTTNHNYMGSNDVDEKNKENSSDEISSVSDLSIIETSFKPSFEQNLKPNLEQNLEQNLEPNSVEENDDEIKNIFPDNKCINPNNILIEENSSDDDNLSSFDFTRKISIEKENYYNDYFKKIKLNYEDEYFNNNYFMKKRYGHWNENMFDRNINQIQIPSPIPSPIPIELKWKVEF